MLTSELKEISEVLYYKHKQSIYHGWQLSFDNKDVYHILARDKHEIAIDIDRKRSKLYIDKCLCDIQAANGHVILFFTDKTEIHFISTTTTPLILKNYK